MHFDRDDQFMIDLVKSQKAYSTCVRAHTHTYTQHMCTRTYTYVHTTQSLKSIFGLNYRGGIFLLELQGCSGMGLAYPLQKQAPPTYL